jgi:hypothetical protein
MIKETPSPGEKEGETKRGGRERERRREMTIPVTGSYYPRRNMSSFPAYPLSGY